MSSDETDTNKSSQIRHPYLRVVLPTLFTTLPLTFAVESSLRLVGQEGLAWWASMFGFVAIFMGALIFDILTATLKINTSYRIKVLLVYGFMTALIALGAVILLIWALSADLGIGGLAVAFFIAMAIMAWIGATPIALYRLIIGRQVNMWLQVFYVITALMLIVGVMYGLAIGIKTAFDIETEPTRTTPDLSRTTETFWET